MTEKEKIMEKIRNKSSSVKVMEQRIDRLYRRLYPTATVAAGTKVQQESFIQQQLFDQPLVEALAHISRRLLCLHTAVPSITRDKPAFRVWLREMLDQLELEVLRTSISHIDVDRLMADDYQTAEYLLDIMEPLAEILSGSAFVDRLETKVNAYAVGSDNTTGQQTDNRVNNSNCSFDDDDGGGGGGERSQTDRQAQLIDDIEDFLAAAAAASGQRAAESAAITSDSLQSSDPVYQPHSRQRPSVRSSKSASASPRKSVRFRPPSQQPMSSVAGKLQHANDQMHANYGGGRDKLSTAKIPVVKDKFTQGIQQIHQLLSASPRTYRRQYAAKLATKYPRQPRGMDENQQQQPAAVDSNDPQTRQLWEAINQVMPDSQLPNWVRQTAWQRKLEAAKRLAIDRELERRILGSKQAEINHMLEQQRLQIQLAQKEMIEQQKFAEKKRRERVERELDAERSDRYAATVRMDKYYREAEEATRSYMVRRRNKEEVLMAQLLRDAAKRQRETIREQRAAAKEAKQQELAEAKIKMEAKRNYLADQVAIAKERLTAVKQEQELREKALKEEWRKERRDRKHELKDRISVIKQRLATDGSDFYFRELDVQAGRSLL